MGKLEEVTIGLPAEDIEAVRRAVADGDYASEADALSAAIRSWRDRQASMSLSDEDLGALWDQGIASGAGRFDTFDELLEEAERRRSGKSVQK